MRIYDRDEEQRLRQLLSEARRVLLGQHSADCEWRNPGGQCTRGCDAAPVLAAIDAVLAQEEPSRDRFRAALERLVTMGTDDDGHALRGRCLCGRPTGVSALMACARAALGGGQ